MRWAFASLLVLAVTACGGGGGRAAPIGVLDYEVRVAPLPVVGVQVGRPFTLRVTFVATGTNTPVAVPATENLSVRIADGTGRLDGVLEVAAEGDTDLEFSGLTLDTAGTFRLEVTGPAADNIGLSNEFTVSAPLDLVFATLPSRVFERRPFAVRVNLIDATTRAPVVPAAPIEIQLGVERGAGAVQTLSGVDSVLFEGLTVAPGGTSTRVTATAFGFPAATSSDITVDRLRFANARLEGTSGVIGSEFFVRATIVADSTGSPFPIDPPVEADVSADRGGLAGVTRGSSAGTDLRIGPMTFANGGDVTLSLTAQGLEQVGLLATFRYALRILADGGTEVLPDDELGPFAFRFEDALGGVYVGPADSIVWRLHRRRDNALIGTGQAVFDATGVAAVTVPGIAEVDSYRLVASAGAIPDAVSGDTSVDFEVVARPVDGIGPAIALASTRVGMAYRDSVAFAAIAESPGNTGDRFGRLAGSLPPGLVLNRQTGELTGVVTAEGSYSFSIWSRRSGVDVRPLRCTLAAFRADESDVPATPPDFSMPGPNAGQVSIVDDTWTFVSSFDGVAYSTAARVWMPPSSTWPVPLFVVHRARDVGYTEYDALARHLAGWGIACASVDDYQSFRDPTARTPNPVYDAQVIEAGMQSAGAFLEATAARLATRAATTGDALAGAFEPGRVVYGGHGFGGGAVQAAHVRSVQNGGVGFVYLAPFDLRLSPFTAPPGDPRGTPMFAIPDAQPRAPQLVITAENDGEIAFPIGDQLGERRTGPSTVVTVYGGVHSYFTDSRGTDAARATISRASQHAVVFRYVTAFVKRWAEGARELDGLLYGSFAAGSSEVGVQTWRAMTGLVLVDDFQDLDESRNRLGGVQSLSAGSRVEESSYPPLGGLSSLRVRQNVLFLANQPTATYATNFAPLDVSDKRRLLLRIGQDTSIGFDWVTIRVRLADGAPAVGTVTVWNRFTQVPTYLPNFELLVGPNTYDRLLDLQIPLTGFGGFDRTDLRRIEIVFETDGGPSATRKIFLDDIRFE